MKKVSLLVALSAVLLIGAAGCKKKTEATDNATAPAAVEAPAADNTTAPVDNTTPAN